MDSSTYIAAFLLAKGSWKKNYRYPHMLMYTRIHVAASYGTSKSSVVNNYKIPLRLSFRPE
ncbi:hypothetical protein PILCRDRAFT_812621 [Piloderma croceum F 1598]|uniref:Uncharacterized protein n=1 Tax=Piloderma croceum (strain F 1598) TaxID=765440 RepID=A0A0C3BTE4_PILCF|nr:hypothetical protein PILCRDRAFT_812621 [Piloderma croceum F 1598]